MTLMRAPRTIVEAQDQLLDILLLVDQIARASGLTYFISGGTALGAVRHQDFVPWDSDVDIVVPAPTYDDFVAALEARLPPTHVVYNWRRPGYEHLFARVCPVGVDHKDLHVDIFPIAGASPRRVGQRRQELWGRILCTIFTLKRCVPRERFAHTVKKRIVAEVARRLLVVVSERRCLGWFERLLAEFPLADAQWVVSPCGTYLFNEIFPAVHFRASSVATMRGREFPAPDRVEDYLRVLYGDFHELPPTESQEKEVRLFYEHNLPRIRASLGEEPAQCGPQS